MVPSSSLEDIHVGVAAEKIQKNLYSVLNVLIDKQFLNIVFISYQRVIIKLQRSNQCKGLQLCKTYKVIKSVSRCLTTHHKVDLRPILSS